MSIPGTASTDGATRKPSQVLDAAADLIEPEGAWTQGAMKGRRPDGSVCWCAAGALSDAADGLGSGYGTATFFTARRTVAECLRPGLPTWADAAAPIITFNDQPNRSQAEVVAALRKAAELARSEGQ